MLEGLRKHFRNGTGISGEVLGLVAGFAMEVDG
jgi:hypothetical protein